jgi:hypothetical protein
VEKLKLSTVHYDAIGAYRVTAKGAEVVASTERVLKEEVREALRCPVCSRPVVIRINRVRSEGRSHLVALRICDACCGKCEERCADCEIMEEVDFFSIERVPYTAVEYLPEATR